LLVEAIMRLLVVFMRSRLILKWERNLRDSWRNESEHGFGDEAPLIWPSKWPSRRPGRLFGRLPDCFLDTFLDR
jgi:hypothetical protein